MAQPVSTVTPARQTIGLLEVTFTIPVVLNGGAQSPLAIRQETRTWLEGFGATVQSIQIRQPE